MLKLLTRVFGSRNDRLLRTFDRLVSQANGFESAIQALSDEQLAAKTPADKTARYAPVKVTLLVPYGDGWLVQGVDDDDDVVVHGTGVLWSLEGVGAHPADDDDED